MNCRVNYQPKVRLADRRICGFEALARWHHPQRGWIPPGEFIPVAEETGLIHDLDMWILRAGLLPDAALAYALIRATRHWPSA